ncbi:hypothetical protein GCM10011403_21650 [Pseudohongiella nitratireducens]|uniref:Uncharacterized protein n=1 Tax=Pseudohongiella nitratireducens TaxID=1768907 RepID=A0A916VJF3_9GAMM|nr:hypothetical protein GCM10011403_21650 [Pseudohongiella nitratireducens]
MNTPGNKHSLNDERKVPSIFWMGDDKVGRGSNSGAKRLLSDLIGGPHSRSMIIVIHVRE